MNKDLRNKLGSYEPPYNPQHWEQLSQRLAYAQQQRNHWYYAAVAALALFILVGIGVFLYEPTSSVAKSEINHENDTIAKTELAVPKIANRTTNEITNKAIDKTEEKSREQIKQGQLAPENNVNDNKISEINKINSKNISKNENNPQNRGEVAKNTINNNNKVITKNKKYNKITKKVLKSKNKMQKVANPNDNKIAQNKIMPNKMSRVGEGQVGVSKNSSFENNSLLATKINNEIIENLMSHEMTGFKTLRFPAIGSASMLDTTKKLIAYYKVIPNKIASTKTKFPLRVGAVVMPMLATWTTRDGQQTQGFMINAGVLAEWKIGRFLVGSGVLVSNYTLTTPQEKGLDFAIDTAYQLNLFVSSQQNIQELLIPISLRYDFKTTEKGKWFIGANIFNSYLLSEQFSQTTVAKYFNTTANLSGNANNKTSYSENRETQHRLQFFSAIQLQTGYERVVTKHLSYQIEPFFRVGLQSQNNNNLQLYAAGVSLRVNYN